MGIRLFEQVRDIGEQGKLAGFFDRFRNFALVLERVAGDTSGQYFALLIDELEQEVCIFVINIANPEAAETAIFRPLLANFGITQELYFVSGWHLNSILR